MPLPSSTPPSQRPLPLRPACYLHSLFSVFSPLRLSNLALLHFFLFRYIYLVLIRHSRDIPLGQDTRPSLPFSPLRFFVPYTPPKCLSPLYAAVSCLRCICHYGVFGFFCSSYAHGCIFSHVF
ncbi:hypothetical protein H112_04187 [Trichophyton rubrum D6]|uniref:Uncharacterized protein n=3 Tax=Trichophyton TaxID=5550 RepID=A0A080WG97_TRIRC|nr:uncharacterized protein TERG_12086 [Trichophyton rubrum CBS 118892]EZF23033.1 hypothetical protein H100_04192 [Trichophyton rubrum MR850]EZF42074.1 hypothetical protein H102_04181 [Trichophyton rubrum CBS 100081]EZF52729.1 hypothetical protein H103_04189 [Trichophyton rubrum CBS 288.86]EZF63330.1 hypothetical protein H104_04178 [Trichophyton rubrum CBS 289.86]EZF73867.1 hypothetical protein H105_04206 [Trichophyton soudanense CBS 452.61]EZF84642.1 hypothetical protein H110_04182 [Trichophy